LDIALDIINLSIMADFTLNINKKEYKVSVDPETPVLWVLRDHLKLYGTKYSCGIGVCGACTIHVDGEIRKSCSMAVSEVGTSKITTIEGLEGKHPVQEAWLEDDVAQCGYCQPGQIMAAVALLNENPTPSTADIRSAMSDNICRCGTYTRINKAIKKASDKINS
jgi:isoquinoline 1-oxidoreductase alpha subunit